MEVDFSAFGLGTLVGFRLGLYSLRPAATICCDFYRVFPQTQGTCARRSGVITVIIEVVPEVRVKGHHRQEYIDTLYDLYVVQI